jgi:hypothetical protein
MSEWEYENHLNISSINYQAENDFEQEGLWNKMDNSLSRKVSNEEFIEKPPNFTSETNFSTSEICKKDPPLIPNHLLEKTTCNEIIIEEKEETDICKDQQYINLFKRFCELILFLFFSKRKYFSIVKRGMKCDKIDIEFIEKFFFEPISDLLLNLEVNCQGCSDELMSFEIREFILLIILDLKNAKIPLINDNLDFNYLLTKFKSISNFNNFLSTLHNLILKYNNFFLSEVEDFYKKFI